MKEYSHEEKNYAPELDLTQNLAKLKQVVNFTKNKDFQMQLSAFQAKERKRINQLVLDNENFMRLEKEIHHIANTSSFDEMLFAPPSPAKNQEFTFEVLRSQASGVTEQSKQRHIEIQESIVEEKTHDFKLNIEKQDSNLSILGQRSNLGDYLDNNAASDLMSSQVLLLPSIRKIGSTTSGQQRNSRELKFRSQQTSPNRSNLNPFQSKRNSRYEKSHLAIEDIRPQNIANHHLLMNKQYQGIISRESLNMSNERALKIIGLDPFMEEYEKEQQNEANDSDLEEYWQPLQSQNKSSKAFQLWSQDQDENPKKMLEDARKNLVTDFAFNYKKPADLFDSKLPITVPQSPVIHCYDSLMKLQEKGKLYHKLPLKQVLEQDKLYFEEILNKMKRAHQIQMRMMKQSLRSNFLKIMDHKLQSVKDCLKNEIGVILAQVQKKDDTIASQLLQIKDLQWKLRDAEAHLSEVVRQQVQKDIKHLKTVLEEKGRKAEISHQLYMARLEYDVNQEIERRKNFLTRKDPLLNKQFCFYNAYILLELRDKDKLAALQIFEDMNEVITAKTIENESVKLEYTNLQYILSQYQISEMQKDQKIFELSQKVDHLQSEYDNLKFNFDVKIKDLISKFIQQKDQWTQNVQHLQDMVSTEIEVRETIQDILMRRNDEKRAEIRKLRLILKTPRLYQQYLRDIGVSNKQLVASILQSQYFNQKEKQQPFLQKKNKSNQQTPRNFVGHKKMMTRKLTNSMDFLLAPSTQTNSSYAFLYS